jgi:DNA topoisomerase-1
MKVCDFLLPNFNDFFMDIKFTAGLEEDLDFIANSKKGYVEVIKPVYDFMMKKINSIKATKKEVIHSGTKCPICKKGDIVEKISRFGKFWSCDQYPKCKSVFLKNEDGTFTEKGSTKKEVEYSSDKCPLCGGKMIIREGKYGKFQGCSKYPKCRGMRKEDGSIVEVKKKKWKSKKG